LSFAQRIATFGIRIVADFGSRIFQFTAKVDANYNAYIYYYLGYKFYDLLAVVIFLFFISFITSSRAAYITI